MASVSWRTSSLSRNAKGIGIGDGGGSGGGSDGVVVFGRRMSRLKKNFNMSSMVCMYVYVGEYVMCM